MCQQCNCNRGMVRSILIRVVSGVIIVVVVMVLGAIFGGD